MFCDFARRYLSDVLFVTGQIQAIAVDSVGRRVYYSLYSGTISSVPLNDNVRQDIVTSGSLSLHGRSSNIVLTRGLSC